MKKAGDPITLDDINNFVFSMMVFGQQRDEDGYYNIFVNRETLEDLRCSAYYGDWSYIHSCNPAVPGCVGRYNGVNVHLLPDRPKRRYCAYCGHRLECSCDCKVRL